MSTPTAILQKRAENIILSLQTDPNLDLKIAAEETVEILGEILEKVRILERAPGYFSVVPKE